MKLKPILLSIIAILFSPTLSIAQSPTKPVPPKKALDTKDFHPNPSKLEFMCGYLQGRKQDDTPNTPYGYMYERFMYEAAGADLNTESPEIIQAKIQYMWNLYGKNVKCSDLGFSVSRGNLLKYAFNRSTYDFIDLAIDDWHLDLNFVDESDNRTVLDYLKSEIERGLSQEIDRQLRDYFRRLRQAGAKYRAELP